MSFNTELEKSLRLCAVTDRHWISRPYSGNVYTLEEQVEEAIRGGATMIQLREKHLDTDAFIALAKSIKKVASRYEIPLVINDNLEVALASGAEGLHIGQDDGDAAMIRKSLGKHAILGISAHTEEEAVAAERAGADYIGVGAVFPTGSKDDVSVLPRKKVREICASVSIPSIAIGGITPDNAHLLSGCGLAGIASISAIFADPPHVREAAEKLAGIVLSVLKER